MPPAELLPQVAFRVRQRAITGSGTCTCGDLNGVNFAGPCCPNNKPAVDPATVCPPCMSSWDCPNTYWLSLGRGVCFGSGGTTNRFPALLPRPSAPRASANAPKLNPSLQLLQDGGQASRPQQPGRLPAAGRHRERHGVVRLRCYPQRRDVPLPCGASKGVQVLHEQ